MENTKKKKVQSNAPEDGRNCRPKHVELIWIYQQTVTVASRWLSSLPSLLMMHGETNIKVHILHYVYYLSDYIWLISFGYILSFTSAGGRWSM
jgi:hypothetical protein